MIDEDFEKLIKDLLEEKDAVRELTPLFNSLQNSENKDEKNMIESQIKRISDYIKIKNSEIGESLGYLVLSKTIRGRIETTEERPKKLTVPKKIKLTSLEKTTLKRLKAKEEEKQKNGQKVKKPSSYVKIANRIFSNISKKILEKNFFTEVEKDLSKTNMELTMQSYISVALLTVLMTLIISVGIFLFLIFFSVKDFPTITPITTSISARALQIFWVIIILPIGMFIFMYMYPSIERKSLETKINQELPFAAIHMATISGASIEPSKIFSIIIATKEYPNLQIQFTKLINFINIYGYDLVNALRRISETSPSKKLSDLMNSLAVTINSGGSLSQFFNKRAETLLFEYKLEREKYIKFSETFMDIYISAVIAAPMMLMLLLMMMKVSGLGLALSNDMISAIMVLGVSMINIAFLVFLHIKQQGGE